MKSIFVFLVVLLSSFNGYCNNLYYDLLDRYEAAEVKTVQRVVDMSLTKGTCFTKPERNYPKYADMLTFEFHNLQKGPLDKPRYWGVVIKDEIHEGSGALAYSKRFDAIESVFDNNPSSFTKFRLRADSDYIYVGLGFSDNSTVFPRGNPTFMCYLYE